VGLSVRDMYETRGVAPQIQQGMETGSSRCSPESCLGENGQTQVYRRGIQGVDRIQEFHGHGSF